MLDQLDHAHDIERRSARQEAVQRLSGKAVPWAAIPTVGIVDLRLTQIDAKAFRRVVKKRSYESAGAASNIEKARWPSNDGSNGGKLQMMPQEADPAFASVDLIVESRRDLTAVVIARAVHS